MQGCGSVRPRWAPSVGAGTEGGTLAAPGVLRSRIAIPNRRVLVPGEGNASWAANSVPPSLLHQPTPPHPPPSTPVRVPEQTRGPRPPGQPHRSCITSAPRTRSAGRPRRGGRHGADPQAGRTAAGLTRARLTLGPSTRVALIRVALIRVASPTPGRVPAPPFRRATRCWPTRARRAGARCGLPGRRRLRPRPRRGRRVYLGFARTPNSPTPSACRSSR